MNIRLDKVEIEMLNILVFRDKRYQRGLESKIRSDISRDYLELNTRFKRM
jgi:hypothetical protein